MRPDAGSAAIFIAVTVLFTLISLPCAYAVHDEAGKTSCRDCHPWLPLNDTKAAFNEGTEKICSRCHNNYHGTSEGFSHPVYIIPSMNIPGDMPLDPTGRITCITCHSYHNGKNNSQREFFMRRSRGNAFCYSCHKKRLF